MAIRPNVAVGSLADILRCDSDVRFTPQKRTFAAHTAMSAKCQ